MPYSVWPSRCARRREVKADRRSHRLKGHSAPPCEPIRGGAGVEIFDGGVKDSIAPTAAYAGQKTQLPNLPVLSFST